MMAKKGMGDHGAATSIWAPGPEDCFRAPGTGSLMCGQVCTVKGCKWMRRWLDVQAAFVVG
jgi:hypothetical protein